MAHARTWLRNLTVAVQRKPVRTCERRLIPARVGRNPSSASSDLIDVRTSAGYRLLSSGGPVAPAGHAVDALARRRIPRPHLRERPVEREIVAVRQARVFRG